MSYGGSHMPRSKLLTEYIGSKLIMLTDEFRIKLTETEIDHMWSLKSEKAVDQYVHDILINKL